MFEKMSNPARLGLMSAGLSLLESSGRTYDRPVSSLSLLGSAGKVGLGVYGSEMEKKRKELFEQKKLTQEKDIATERDDTLRYGYDLGLQEAEERRKTSKYETETRAGSEAKKTDILRDTLDFRKKQYQDEQERLEERMNNPQLQTPESLSLVKSTEMRQKQYQNAVEAVDKIMLADPEGYGKFTQRQRSEMINKFFHNSLLTIGGLGTGETQTQNGFNFEANPYKFRTNVLGQQQQPPQPKQPTSEYKVGDPYQLNKYRSMEGSLSVPLKNITQGYKKWIKDFDTRGAALKQKYENLPPNYRLLEPLPASSRRSNISTIKSPQNTAYDKRRKELEKTHYNVFRP